MTAEKNNPPAFPVVAGQQVYSHGMTLRDWFAGQALIVATMYQTVTPEDLAKDAYRIADAMLSEREKPNNRETLTSKAPHGHTDSHPRGSCGAVGV